jgi:hypothetical protein
VLSSLRYVVSLMDHNIMVNYIKIENLGINTNA